jgi:hypothetical protein
VPAEETTVNIKVVKPLRVSTETADDVAVTEALAPPAAPKPVEQPRTRLRDQTAREKQKVVDIDCPAAATARGAAPCPDSLRWMPSWWAKRCPLGYVCLMLELPVIAIEAPAPTSIAVPRERSVLFPLVVIPVAPRGPHLSPARAVSTAEPSRRWASSIGRKVSEGKQ